jgi:CubicO group peptidase (beta-lactamase class C family)
MEADTIFRIYSMTKPIARVALMTLYERGLFQLNDPVGEYLPELADLSVYVGENRRSDIGTGQDLAGMVKDLGRIPLQADPGDAWIYGVSTDVVGRLCEVLGGRPFDRFLAETILGPQTYFSGSAGLVSTAPDYLRFARMLAHGGTLDGVRIIGPRTLRLMTVNQLPGGRDLTAMALHGGESQREGHGFGLGFGVLLDQAVAQTIGTEGEYFWGGAASRMFLVSPREDLIVLFLTQLRPSSSYPIRRQLRAIVYGAINE